MIKKKIMQVSKKNNTLIVSVSVPRRRWASEEEYYITTEEIIKELSLEYDVLDTIKRPSHPVGNTKKSGAFQSGIWNFLIKKEEIPLVENEKPVRRRKSPPASKQAAKQPTQKKSFRGRMQNIAKNKIENKT